MYQRTMIKNSIWGCQTICNVDTQSILSDFMYRRLEDPLEFSTRKLINNNTLKNEVWSEVDCFMQYLSKLLEIVINSKETLKDQEFVIKNIEVFLFDDKDFRNNCNDLYTYEVTSYDYPTSYALTRYESDISLKSFHECYDEKTVELLLIFQEIIESLLTSYNDIIYKQVNMKYEIFLKQNIKTLKEALKSFYS